MENLLKRVMQPDNLARRKFVFIRTSFNHKIFELKKFTELVVYYHEIAKVFCCCFSELICYFGLSQGFHLFCLQKLTLRNQSQYNIFKRQFLTYPS